MSNSSGRDHVQNLKVNSIVPIQEIEEHESLLQSQQSLLDRNKPTQLDLQEAQQHIHLLQNKLSQKTSNLIK